MPGPIWKKPQGLKIRLLVYLAIVGLVALFWLSWPVIREQIHSQPPVQTLSSKTAASVLNSGAQQISPDLDTDGMLVSNSAGSGNEYIVFSLSDGEFYHLFAYQPEVLPVSRLTNSSWDDIDPNVNAEGDRIAFSSRRNGYWDIYILDLATGELIRVTDTPDFEGHPCWSPDGQWLAYETNRNGNLDIYIQSVQDLSQPPVPLTEDSGQDYAPAWSPEGRQIAFVSTRSGEEEIWAAQLDLVDNRFQNISQNTASIDLNPTWSPDGKQIAWGGQLNGTSQIFTRDLTTQGAIAKVSLYGSNPVWSTNRNVILVQQVANSPISLAAFSLDDGRLQFPLINLSGSLHGMDFASTKIGIYLSNFLKESPAQFTAQGINNSVVTSILPAGRNELVIVPDLEVPYPYLNDAVDESFIALRAEIARQTGWDVLGSLENTFVPINEAQNPGTVDEWLQTGRAFAINSLPVQAGWIAVAKEERGEQTYWRIFIHTRYQDGSQGMPMRTRTWNLDLRYSGDPDNYESGGDFGEIPTGYWVDFTELAERYGWEPLPAMQNWRNYAPAARFNQFVNRSGLDWASAMAEIYSQEALTIPTTIPTLTLTPTLTPSPRFYSSATPQTIPTQTRIPTRRPTWTPDPGEISP